MSDHSSRTLCFFCAASTHDASDADVRALAEEFGGPARAVSGDLRPHTGAVFVAFHDVRHAEACFYALSPPPHHPDAAAQRPWWLASVAYSAPCDWLPDMVGRCKLDPSLKAPGFKSLMVKRMTVLST